MTADGGEPDPAEFRVPADITERRGARFVCHRKVVCCYKSPAAGNARTKGRRRRSEPEPEQELLRAANTRCIHCVRLKSHSYSDAPITTGPASAQSCAAAVAAPCTESRRQMRCA
jgi:hypothetical protein